MLTKWCIGGSNEREHTGRLKQGSGSDLSKTMWLAMSSSVSCLTDWIFRGRLRIKGVLLVCIAEKQNFPI